jgi:hypothetical protein
MAQVSVRNPGVFNNIKPADCQGAQQHTSPYRRASASFVFNQAALWKELEWRFDR